MGRTRIGTSGYSYPHWRGSFYPAALPHARELEYISQRFGSLEVNRSFYSLLRPEMCRAWRDRAPADFVFALKGSRFITHSKKLRDVKSALANFFASGVLAFGSKLGPIVWQLPERLRFDESRIGDFLALLPRTTQEAAALARRHDARVRGRAHTRAERSMRLRHAIEPRDPSYLDAAFARVARRFGVAIAVSDSPEWPLIEELTAGFVYVRLHGSRKTYASRYTDAELASWAARIAAWQRGGEPESARRISRLRPPARRGRDVYVYFDNDYRARAPADALRLMQRLAGQK